MLENNITTKLCKICKYEKQINEFYIEKRNSDGFTHWCKKCWNKKAKDRRIKNKELYSKKMHDFYIKNKKRENENTKTWRK